MILCDRCSTSYDLASFFSWQAQYFRQMEWTNRRTYWYEAVSSALNFPFLKEVSENCFVFEVVNFEKWGSLVELLRLWCCQFQNLRKSRRIASLFPTSLCWVLVFDSVSRSSASAASASSPQHCHTHNIVTYHLSTQTLSHTIFSHTTLSHTLFYTTLSHTIFVTTFLTHHFVTHTHLCNQLSHTPSLSHTTLSHTMAGVALGDIDPRFAWQALGWLWWRAWAGLVAGDAAALCVAGVALGDIHLQFAWQAWHWHWAAYGGALGPGWSPGTPRHFAWQAWHLVTSTFVLRGTRGTWRHRHCVYAASTLSHTALSHTTLYFVWRGRRGTCHTHTLTHTQRWNVWLMSPSPESKDHHGHWKRGGIPEAGT